MKFQKKTIIIGTAIVTCISAIITTSYTLIQRTPKVLNKTVIAKLNGVDITISQIEPKMQAIYAKANDETKGNPMNNKETKNFIIEERKNALNNLIEEQIIQDKFSTFKIAQSDIDLLYDKSLNKFIEQADNNKAKGLEKFNEALQREGYVDSNSYKEFLKMQLENKALFDSILNNVPKVTLSEAQTYYNENKDQYIKPSGANIYQIVVETEQEAQTLRKQFLEETAELSDVQDKLKVFEKLASTNNIDDTKSINGSLGYIYHSSNTYVSNFMDAVKSLKKDGDISNVINSKTNSYSVYNILFATQVNLAPVETSFKDANKDNALIIDLQEQKNEQAIQNTLIEWKNSANIEILTDKLDYRIY